MSEWFSLRLLPVAIFNHVIIICSSCFVCSVEWNAQEPVSLKLNCDCLYACICVAEVVVFIRTYRSVNFLSDL